MPTVQLPNHWEPRPYQEKAWAYLEAGGLRSCLVWHRRSGKDEVALHRTACAAFERVGNYWHMLPLANQARKAIWEAVNPHSGKRRIDEAFPLEVRANTRDDEMFIRFVNGSTWQVVGSDNFESLVGSPPVGLVFSEWAQANPNAWAILRPILLENKGWALFITTPRGRNHAHKTLEIAKKEPSWYGEVLTVKDTNVFSPELLEAEHREMLEQYGAEHGENVFQQEYHCSFDAAIMGAYYAKLMSGAADDKRIARVPYDPKLQVVTAWDLGIGDPTAIWFCQRLGQEVRLIDYYETSGVGLDHYVKLLREKPYVYDLHCLPHDVEAAEMGTGRTRLETLVSLGLNRAQIKVIPAAPVEDGINAARLLIPRCWFDAEKCARGIEALQQYRAEFDDKLKTLKSRPLHDWTSHGADAFRYLAQGIAPQKGKAAKPPAPPKYVV